MLAYRPAGGNVVQQYAGGGGFVQHYAGGAAQTYAGGVGLVQRYAGGVVQQGATGVAQQYAGGVVQYAKPVNQVVHAQTHPPFAQVAYGQQQVLYAEPQVLYQEPQVAYTPEQFPGFVLPTVITPSVLSKLKEHEGHWREVKVDLEKMYNQICPSGQGSLQQMQAWFDAIGQKYLGQAIGSEMNVDIFERFDFDGDGSLEWHEAYRCLKRVSTQLLHRGGHMVDTNVPFQTPLQGGYTIIKELARGGQGAALLAQHATLGECCVKEYEKNNENAGGIEELIAEMEHLKMLKNPLVMATYEIFQDADHYYCVNELLPGGDLSSFRRKCIENGIGLSEPLFKGIFVQCVQALDFIHVNGVMHCDIKEPNIMIKNKDYRNAKICLIDFGLAQDAAGGGQAGGTPGYTPPETCVPPNKWFPRGDVFSMGVVFFQLLADKSPDEETGKMGIFQEGFTGNIEDIVRFVQTRQPPFHLIQGRFPGTVGFLSKMLAKQRKQRPKPSQLLKDPWFASNEVLASPALAAPALATTTMKSHSFHTPGVTRAAAVQPTVACSPAVGPRVVGSQAPLMSSAVNGLSKSPSTAPRVMKSKSFSVGSCNTPVNTLAAAVPPTVACGPAVGSRVVGSQAPLMSSAVNGLSNSPSTAARVMKSKSFSVGSCNMPGTTLAAAVPPTVACGPAVGSRVVGSQAPLMSSAATVLPNSPSTDPRVIKSKSFSVGSCNTPVSTLAAAVPPTRAYSPSAGSRVVGSQGPLMSSVVNRLPNSPITAARVIKPTSVSAMPGTPGLATKVGSSEQGKGCVIA